MNNNKNKIPKNSCNFCVEIKKIIRGQEKIKKINDLLYLQKIIKKITNEKKFSWEPKLSDFNIGDKINKTSELDIVVNSKSFFKFTNSKPFKKI